MTSSGAATILREHWLDMVTKAPIERLFHGRNPHGHLGSEFSRSHRNGGFSVNYRPRHTFLDANDRRSRRDKFQAVGELPAQFLVPAQFHNELLPRLWTGKCNLAGKDNQIG